MDFIGFFVAHAPIFALGAVTMRLFHQKVGKTERMLREQTESLRRIEEWLAEQACPACGHQLGGHGVAQLRLCADTEQERMVQESEMPVVAADPPHPLPVARVVHEKQIMCMAHWDFGCRRPECRR